ncbi:MAG: hypothetical protein GY757_28860 [bacterium]|nr:hypothetical protein [bacterium]
MSSRNNGKKSAHLIFITLFITLLVPSLRARETKTETERDKLEYNIAVNVTLVPFVATDTRGNPVFDLKNEDLEVTVNKKKMQPGYLHAIAFNKSKKTTPKEATHAKLKPQIEANPKRLKFIIIDALFNSTKGLKHAKMLGKKIVKEATPDDRFILLQIGMDGLQFVAGPEPGGKPFLEHFKKLRKHPHRLLWWKDPQIDDGESPPPRHHMMHGQKRARQQTLKMYRDSFVQFKNALKTIDGPKVTFLFTEGFADQAHRDIELFKDISQLILNDIHAGGSLLHKVHMQHVRSKTIEPAAVIANNSIAAYYELSFNAGTQTGEKMIIDIKCKRKGVIINAVGHKDKKRPYLTLKGVRKKLFAMNVATGSASSNMLGRVRLAPYRKLNSKNTKNGTEITVQVPIPTIMRHKKLDFFTLSFDEKFADADVQIANRVSQKFESITLRTTSKKKNLYFVIVEPSETYCLFSKVKLEI